MASPNGDPHTSSSTLHGKIILLGGVASVCILIWAWLSAFPF